VQQAAVGLSLPYERSLITGGIAIRDGNEAGQSVTADEVYITPDCFAALRIPLLAGRSFRDGDTAETQRVAIVNETFLRKYFHGTNPLGRYLDKDTRIVGVVGDVTMAPGMVAVAPLTNEETMYVPAAQMEAQQLALLHIWFQPSWVVRTSGPVDGLTAPMQRALASVDPNLPFTGFYRMRDLMAKTLSMQRVQVALLSGLASLALMLSAVGIFAMVANLVTRRTQEIGIRMALGSTIHQAMVQMGRSGAGAALAGLVLGLAISAVSLRAMRSVRYGIAVYDAPTIVAVIVTLLSVTLFAATVPVLRIAPIDPAQTLRDE
jgi:MacB-like periplasmic core domain